MERCSLNRKFKNNDLKKKFHRKWSPDEVKRVDQSSVNDSHNCQSKSYDTSTRGQGSATPSFDCHVSSQMPHQHGEGQRGATYAFDCHVIKGFKVAATW